MIWKTRAISILTNNVRDHAIRVGPHTAASEILVELVLIPHDVKLWVSYVSKWQNVRVL